MKIINTNLRGLDVGCGKKKHKDCFGIDVSKDSHADLMYNIENGLPFKNNQFEIIYCENIVEHIKNFDLLFKELYRISKDKCKVIIKTPHFSSRYAWMDLTHIRPYAFNSFDDIEGFKVKSKKLIYIDANKFYMKIVLKTMFFVPNNLALLFPKIFERFLCYLFGGIDYIDIEMEVIKL